MSSLAPVSIVPLYAGFWRRAAASLMDGIVLFIPNAVFGWYYAPDGTTALLTGAAIGTAYYAGFHGSVLQATPGKWALGVKVTDLRGERIGPIRAIARYFATWLSTAVFGLGYVLAGVSARRQALHDMIASTLVVNRKAAPAEVTAGGGTMPVTVGVAIAIVLVFFLPLLGGIAAAIAIPAYQDYQVRARIAEVVSYGGVLKSEVEKSLRDRQPYQGGPLTTLPASAQSVEVSENGEIVMNLAPSVMSGGRIILTPTAGDAGAVSWQCHAENVSEKYLPERCRS
jgi:uncharacterized RDD family membrane protein YckC/Tfp pilus assembly major pilin PilA